MQANRRREKKENKHIRGEAIEVIQEMTLPKVHHQTRETIRQQNLCHLFGARLLGRSARSIERLGRAVHVNHRGCGVRLSAASSQFLTTNVSLQTSTVYKCTRGNRVVAIIVILIFVSSTDVSTKYATPNSASQRILRLHTPRHKLTFSKTVAKKTDAKDFSCSTSSHGGTGSGWGQPA